MKVEKFEGFTERAAYNSYINQMKGNRTMKKILMLTTALFVLSAPAAYAEQDAGGHHEGPGSGKGKDRIFEKGDTDGDGYISWDESLVRHKERFDKMDGDGDGKVSQEEAKAAHEKMREMRKEFHEKRQEKREERHQDDADQD